MPCSSGPPTTSFILTMRLQHIHQDILLYILSHANMESLLCLAQTSSTLRFLIKKFFLSRWRQELSKYFLPPTETRMWMRYLHIVASGSSALRQVLPNTTEWQNNDLDFYCPQKNTAPCLEFLFKQGYHVICSEEPLPPDDSTSPLPYHGPGILAVIPLQHPGQKKIDVVISTNDNALLPIATFWGSVVQNYMAADSFAIAYPRNTLKRIGYIAPDRAHLAKTVRCVQKYHTRGFTILEYDTVIHQGYCPAQLRSFDDEHTLRFSFTDPPHYYEPQFHYWRLKLRCPCEGQTVLPTPEVHSNN